MKLLTRNGIFVDFNNDYCETSEEIINSDLFQALLIKFTKRLERKRIDYYLQLVALFSSNDEFIINFKNVIKTALIFDFAEIVSPLASKREELLLFIEEFYNFYRKLERYSFSIINNDDKLIKRYLRRDLKFNSLVLQTYRQISENIKDEQYLVYRQLNAGSNAGFVLMEKKFDFANEYQKLNSILTIHSTIFYPPFIVYPKNTKREGIFKEGKINPLNYLNNEDDFIMYPIYVGRLKAYCYFNIEYASLGVSLSNLFTPIKEKDLDSHPDMIFLYGVSNDDLKEPYYYKDEANDLYVGITFDNEEMSYFGYMKKMLLTMHNLICIDNGELPIHGAMVSLNFLNGDKKNIVIMGDSGAGKSETLEALKQSLEDDISDIKVIFDDMGSFKIVDGKVIAYGSETGAFVRIDDLESGYAYKEIDRAIFMSPDKKNARTIIPVTSLDIINKGEKVDMFFYANNYEDKEGIRLFDNYKDAYELFKEGKRKAKQTTSEEGIVTSYFANPFGPLQRKDLCDELIEKYFSLLFANKVVVGEIYTRLAILGFEKNGPREAAKSLINFLK